MKKWVLFLFLLGCYGPDAKIPAVSNFDIDKYLGVWYEIARGNNNFEKGCSEVKAHYTKRTDGGIDVVNSCFRDGKVKTAKGVGYLKGQPSVGNLKVSFFRPFYARYDVIYVDEGYQNAIVYGGKPEYLWILSRTSTIEDSTLQLMLSKIKDLGLENDKLIFNQDF